MCFWKGDLRFLTYTVVIFTFGCFRLYTVPCIYLLKNLNKTLFFKKDIYIYFYFITDLFSPIEPSLRIRRNDPHLLTHIHTYQTNLPPSLLSYQLHSTSLCYILLPSHSFNFRVSAKKGHHHGMHHNQHAKEFEKVLEEKKGISKNKQVRSKDEHGEAWRRSNYRNKEEVEDQNFT